MSWLVTALIVSILFTFVACLIGLRHLPKGERPRVATYDRYGNYIGHYPNPGPDIAPGRPGDTLTRRTDQGENDRGDNEQRT